MKTHTAHSVGHGALWSILNNGLSQILVLAVFLVTARFVSQEAFGVMAVCFVIIELFRQITIESIGMAATARPDPQDKDYNACFLTILVVSAAAAGLVYIFAPLAAGLLNDENIEPALRMTSVLLLTFGLSRTHETWLSRHMRFKTLALRSLCSIVIGGTVGIYMAVNGYGLASLITQQIITGLTGTAFLWGAAGWKPGLTTDRESVKGLWHGAKHIAIAETANFFSGQSDTFFASYYLGAAATGVYNAAKRILHAVNTILFTALGKVSLPAFAAIQHDSVLLRRSYTKAVHYTSVLVAPIFAGIAALAGDMIYILLGSDWMNAAPVLSIFALMGYVMTVGQYNRQIFLVSGKTRLQTILAVISALAGLILLFISARYGLAAMAIALTARAVFMHPVMTAYALSILRMRLRDYISGLWPSMLAATLMGAAVYLLRVELMPIHILPRTVLLISIGVGLYTALIFILDRKTFYELTEIVRKVMFRHPA